MRGVLVAPDVHVGAPIAFGSKAEAAGLAVVSTLYSDMPARKSVGGKKVPWKATWRNGRQVVPSTW
jgi:hypothetical protein